jgi:hypothetical protein
MNTMNFNTLMGIENESTPEVSSEKKELTTFQRVVLTSVGVGLIAGSAFVVMKTADHAVGEVKAGVEGFKEARAKSKDEKKSKKAVEMHAFTQKLIDEGYSKEEALELTKAEYGLKG